MNTPQIRGKLKPPNLRTALRAMPNIGDIQSGKKLGYQLQKRYQILESRVTLLEAENVLLRSQMEGMSIPSQAEDSSLGVCRDLTGGILDSRMKGKSTLAGNCETNVSSSLTRSFRTSTNGVPVEQSAGKLAANSGKPKGDNSYGNPDLAGDISLRARVETLHCPPQVGEEKVHSPGKLGGKSASPGPTQAALTQWRWINAPNSGNAKREDTHANPDLADSANYQARVETLQSALPTRTDKDKDNGK